MNQEADTLGRVARERSLRATRADPRWNMLDQHAPAIHIQYLAYELLRGGFAAADMAFER
ncbi:MAG: hypothetical protein A3I63_08380 [Betaproteobacteria bacterium RIFCSPLOWO2_02_FULL_66_14]|nr:MAG: hypothetical protein A3I63_08380 [Betaproteobacteria bacterium RIFCSPLOWO2_02_FULL_66_14]